MVQRIPEVSEALGIAETTVTTHLGAVYAFAKLISRIWLLSSVISWSPNSKDNQYMARSSALHLQSGNRRSDVPYPTSATTGSQCFLIDWLMTATRRAASVLSGNSVVGGKSLLSTGGASVL
jgi:hypothetical protein